MADNYAATQGSGTTFASDDVGGVHYPIVKLAQGALDAATLVSSASPLPVDSELPAAAALADATANPTTPLVGAAVEVFNGSTWDRARGDTANGLDVDVTRQPARARTTDSISVAQATDAIMSSTTALTPKFAAIAANSSGDNTLVAAVASKKIRVLSLALVAAGAVSIYFTSAAAGTVIFGGSTNKIALAANGGFVLPFSPIGWFENSSTNQALVINLSGAVAVSGGLTYVEV